MFCILKFILSCGSKHIPERGRASRKCHKTDFWGLFCSFLTSIHGSGCAHLFPGGAELRMCDIGGITELFESDTAGTAGGLRCM